MKGLELFLEDAAEKLSQQDSKTSQEGFEPPTVRLEGGCSILLSYCDKFSNKAYYME